VQRNPTKGKEKKPYEVKERIKSTQPRATGQGVSGRITDQAKICKTREVMAKSQHVGRRRRKSAATRKKFNPLERKRETRGNGQDFNIQGPVLLTTGVLERQTNGTKKRLHLESAKTTSEESQSGGARASSHEKAYRRLRKDRLFDRILIKRGVCDQLLAQGERRPPNAGRGERRTFREKWG